VNSKRLGILREKVPAAGVIAVLFDPNFPEAVEELRAVEEASGKIEQKIISVQTANEQEFDAASKAWFRRWCTSGLWEPFLHQ
jgi:hypothetical protein